jgi:hypothetical protein
VISATIDTSVYIRALHFGGPATVIIGHARAGSIRIDISDGHSRQEARGKLLALGNHASPTETLHVIKEDPDDDRILECASTAHRTSSSARTQTCFVWGNSVMPGSYRSGISSIWRSRQEQRDNSAFL